MASLDHRNPEHVRLALEQLRETVRELTYAFAKPVKNSDCRNLLARPVTGAACRVCGLPGHQSNKVNNAPACRNALLSLIKFWETTAERVMVLYRGSKEFEAAVRDNKPAYEMSFDDYPVVGGGLVTTVVDRVTRNYLKFQRHMTRIKAKVQVILGEADMKRFEAVSGVLNDLLLGGLTYGVLVERSLAEKINNGEAVSMP